MNPETRKQADKALRNKYAKPKLCPFCGREPHLSQFHDRCFTVTCDCGAESPKDSVSPSGAVRIWNRRRAEALLESRLLSLTTALEKARKEIEVRIEGIPNAPIGEQASFLRRLLSLLPEQKGT